MPLHLPRVKIAPLVCPAFEVVVILAVLSVHLLPPPHHTHQHNPSIHLRPSPVLRPSSLLACPPHLSLCFPLVPSSLPPLPFLLLLLPIPLHSTLAPVLLLLLLLLLTCYLLPRSILYYLAVAALPHFPRRYQLVPLHLPKKTPPPRLAFPALACVIQHTLSAPHLASNYWSCPLLLQDPHIHPNPNPPPITSSSSLPSTSPPFYFALIITTLLQTRIPYILDYDIPSTGPCCRPATTKLPSPTTILFRF